MASRTIDTKSCHAEYKVPGGKLLRVDVIFEEERIGDLKITGDFFLHPEEAILRIESVLRGCRIEEIPLNVSRLVAEQGFKLIGFSGEDLRLTVARAKEHAASEEVK